MDNPPKISITIRFHHSPTSLTSILMVRFESVQEFVKWFENGNQDKLEELFQSYVSEVYVFDIDLGEKKVLYTFIQKDDYRVKYNNRRRRR